jgi:uncharacterized membrane protein
MFAIALTLLVVGIQVPDLQDGDSVSELWDALGDVSSSMISFAISFAVIGRYWLAHHQFFSLLKGTDQGLIGLNLLYLGFIAFLPFPTALFGTFFENPLAFAIYAVAVAVVSGMEVVLFRHAYRRNLLARPLTEDVYRFGVKASLTPVFFFLASIPIAFVDSGIAAASWFLQIPFQRWLVSRKPDDAEELLG